MKLEDFLIKEEGDDSRHLADGRVASTWDKIGHVWNIGPGLTHGITSHTVWTPEQLKAAEDAEFAATRAAVTHLVKIPLSELGENRTTVLESFTYNVGIGGFAHSTVLRDVNARKFDAVPAALRPWNKAKGRVVPGLIKRRADEIRLWEHPDHIPAPADLKTAKNVPSPDAPVDHSTMPLGKQKARAAVQAPAFNLFADPVKLPPIPASINWGKDVAVWGEMLNRQVPDCTGAAAAHAIQIWTQDAKGKEVTLDDQTVLAFCATVPGYTGDGGAEALSVLETWHTKGFSGHFIDAYPTVDPKSHDQIKAAIWLTGGTYLGLELPLAAQSQAVWDCDPHLPPEATAVGGWGGHAVTAFAYDANGLLCVTWGQVKRLSWSFLQAYCSEAYAPLSKDWIEANGQAPSGFDYPALIAYTAALGNAPDKLPAPAPQPQGESDMTFLGGAVAPAPAPVVAQPVSPFGALVSLGLNNLLNAAQVIGGGLLTSGILPNLLDPVKGPFAALASQNTLAGAIMVGFAWYVSHKVATGTNAATLALIGHPENKLGCRG